MAHWFELAWLIDWRWHGPLIGDGVANLIGDGMAHLIADGVDH